MYDDLRDVIEALTLQMAHNTKQPAGMVQPTVQALVDAALQQYRAAGAPYGDHGAGFLVWLLQRSGEAKH